MDADFSGRYAQELDFVLNKTLRFVPYETNTPRSCEIEIGRDDKRKLPYAVVGEKKLFLTEGSSWREVQEYVAGLLEEQADNSPHLYIDRNDLFFKPNQSSQKPILIDVGCADGNFTLEYIEDIREAYLIEGDPRWNEPLKATFALWAEKVHIVNQFVSDKSDRTIKQIALDDLFANFRGEKIFLKMDLEGWGLKALQGCVNLLKDNDVYVACACYHSDSEYEDIKEYLESVHPEYAVWSSEGVCICWFEKALSYPYFRKGVLRARNRVCLKEEH
ncbi:MAG: hypothetical protein NC409_02970 [Clostridium sp.]|nr:hypothetical protein [Clostridium sp.]